MATPSFCTNVKMVHMVTDAEDGEITCIIKGVHLHLRTHPRLFSPKSIDRGTLAMLSTVDFHPEDRVLDLGCGYGVVGILAAKIVGPDKVIMLDNDPLATAYARLNAELNGVEAVKVVQSEGFAALDEAGFTIILTNPPYHSDFSTAKHFIERGFNRLKMGGRMCLVVKRRTWYENKMRAIFGGVRVEEIDGYFVMTAERRTPQWAKSLRK